LGGGPGELRDPKSAIFTRPVRSRRIVAGFTIAVQTTPFWWRSAAVAELSYDVELLRKLNCCAAR